jgi:FRG domain
MTHNWQYEALKDEDAVFAQLCGRRWLCRGQPEPYNSLFPNIDRDPRDKLSRLDKLKLERESISTFRSTVRFLHHSEMGALDHDQDNIALMVLRHYGVPTRLLDWSKSPYVAAYFAAAGNDTKVGESWTFDESLYEQIGKKVAAVARNNDRRQRSSR